MFEGIASTIIVKLLGDYIENLDNKSLNIAIWSGQVNLQNLTLKASALDAFDLPISVVQGCVGSIDATIPWKSLSSSPVVAKVSDVFLVVQPKKCDKYDEEAESARKLLAKQRRLQNHELFREQQEALEMMGKEKKDDKQQSGDTFMSRMVETVLNNLQVEISNVHVRYEDSSNPKNRIVFGITMEKLSVKSCNENWEEVFMKTAQEAFFKKALLQNLSVYMNNNEIELFSKSIIDTKKFSTHMKKIVTENKFYRRFILNPINGEMKLILQKEGNISLDKPKLTANLLLDDVGLCLDERQYKNLLATLEYMSNYAKFERFRHLRPKGDYTSEDKKLWWEYAINSAKELVEKKHFTWEQVMERKKQRNEYIDLFKRTKEFPWQKKLTDEEKKRLRELEEFLDFEDIIFFRELAHGELKIEKEKNKDFLPKTQKGWFGGWWGSGSQTTPTGEEPNAFELTDEQREELHRTIGYNAKEVAQSTELPDEYITNQFNFFLKKGELKLRTSKVKSSDNESAIVKGVYSNFRTEVGIRSSGSAVVRVTLDDFEVTDHFSDVTQFPKILSRRGEKKGPLAEVFVESKPLNEESDLYIKLILQQVDIAINIPLIQKVLSFFVVPSNLDFSVLQNLAKKQLQDWQKQALTQLKIALESKMLIGLDVLILAPNFIVPIDHKDPQSKVLLLDLGQLVFKSDIDKKEREKRIKNETVEEKDFYDRFDLEMSNIQALISDVQSVKNSSYLSVQSSRVELIEKVNFTMKLGILITKAPNLAETTLEGTIPAIRVNLSPSSMNTVIQLINNIMVLVDNPTGNNKDDVEISGYLKMKSLISNNEWKRYWCELMENGKLMLYASENDLKPAGLIYLNDPSVSVKQLDENDENIGPNRWCVTIPQESGNTNVYFEVENNVLLPKWYQLMQAKTISQAKFSVEETPTSEKLEEENGKDADQKAVQLKLKLGLNELSASVSFSRKVNGSVVEAPLTDLKFQGFTFEMLGRKYDTIMNFGLKSFTVSDNTSQAIDKYLLMSDLSSEQLLAVLKLIIVSDPNSEFYAKNADVILDFIFHKLTIYFDPVVLACFVNFGFEIVDLTSKIEARIPTISPQEIKQVAPKDSNRDTLALNASLSAATVLLVQHTGNVLASAVMADANVAFRMNDNDLEVSGTVGNLLATDHSNVDTKYEEIVGLLGSDEKSLIAFNYSQFMKPPAEKPTSPYYGQFLKLNLESVKIVYLNRVVARIINYFTVDCTPFFDSLGGQDQKKEVKEELNLMLFKIDVLLRNPLVIAPVKYNSEDKILGNLGEIKVSNSLKQVNDCWVENYNIDVQKMNLHTINKGRQSFVVGNMDWVLNVDRAVINPGFKIPGVLVDINVFGVSMTLTQKQYQMIFSLIEGNVNDNGGIESSKPQETKKEDKKIEKDLAKVIDVLVKVNFANLILTVARDVDDPIAKLNMYDLSVDFVQQRSLLSETKVSIRAADAHDLRKESDSQFKTFIDTNIVSETAAEHFILVNVLNEPERELIKVDVQMGNPRIIAVPEVVTQIQYFFTNMEENPQQTITINYDNVPFGDLVVSTNVVLDVDIIFSPNRRLIVEQNNFGKVEIDGKGHTIEFTALELITVNPGMTLLLKNINIKKEIGTPLEKYASMGDNSTIVVLNNVFFIGEEDYKAETINKKSTTKVSVSINHPNIVFPVNASDPESRLFVVKSKLTFVMEIVPPSQHFNVSISELTAFVDIPSGESKTVAPILEPLSLEFEMHEQTSLTGSINTLKASLIGNIKARISYQDVKMITEVVNNFSASMSKLQAPPAVAEDATDTISQQSDDGEEVYEEAKEENEKKATEDAEHQFDLTEYREKIQPTLPKIDTAKKSIVIYDFEFDMTKDQVLSVLMVDDVRGYDIPLLTFTLHKVHLLDTRMKQMGDKTSIRAKIIGDIQAEYYNMRIATWEPIIEPYGIEFFFRRKPNKDPYSRALTRDRYEIRDLETKEKDSSAGLWINVTQSMINTVKSTANVWREEFSNKTKLSQKFDPYLIRNHTGYAMKLIFPYNPKLQRADQVEVLPNQHHSFSLASERTNQLLNVTVCIPEFQNYQLDLKRAGKSHIRNAKGVICMFNIELAQGRKIITVSSGIELRNQCNVPWEVGCQDPNSRTIVSLGVVNPKETIGIPITCVDSGILTIKPTIQTIQYNWSIPAGGLRFTELLNSHKSSKYIKIESKDKQERNSLYAIIKTKFELDEDYKEARERLIRNSKISPLFLQRFYCVLDIKPPLAIDNTLEKPLDFVLYSSDQIPILSGSMAKGEKTFIYSADLNDKLYLKLKVDDAWITRNTILINNKSEDTSALLENGLGNQVKVLIDYAVNTSTAHREVILYTPYWITNHTGETLTIHSVSKLKPIEIPDGSSLMYSFPTENERLMVACNDSEFSDPFSLNNAGTSGNFIIQSKNRKYALGTFISLGEGKFNRTKVVTFYPRYVIVNNTNEKLLIKQCYTDNDQLTKPMMVEANSKLNYYWEEMNVTEPQLTLKTNDDNTSWSAPFRTNALGETFLNLKHEKYPYRPIGTLISVDLKESQGCVFLIVQKPTKPPYLIDNRLDRDVLFSQKGVDKWWTVGSGQMAPYSWDYIKYDHALRLKIGNVTLKDDIDIDKIGKDKRIRLPGDVIIYLRVKPIGPTRVITISYQRQVLNPLLSRKFNLKESTKSMSKVSSHQKLDNVSTNSAEGSVYDDEKEEGEEYNFLIFADIKQIGISFIDNTPSEVAFLLLSGLLFKYATTEKHQFIELMLLKMQLDHQDYNATYPVIFCNTNQSESEFLHFSLCRTVENNTNINTFPYFSVLMRDARLEIDYVFIQKMVDLVGILSTDQEQSNTQESQIAEKMCKPIDVPKSEADAEKLYFETLELNSVRVHVTFKFNQTGEDNSNPLLIFFKQLGVTFTKIDNAPMKFNSLILSYPFMSQDALIDKVKKHYIRQATVQFYKIIGSLDIIGNPIGLFSDIGTGVVDFFYEPASAITKSPDEFASGLAKGSMSLLKNSVHGIGNFASKITGNVGNSLAFLTFDKEYNQQRDKHSTQKPKDIKEGITSGAKSLFRGFVGGATGIVTQPIKGFQEESVGGLIKGVGKGIIGIPLKPVGGIIDLATRTVEGISNSGLDFAKRVRFPRVFSENGAVIKYSLSDAFANYLVLSIDDGIYAKTNKPVYYMPDSSNQYVYLITNRYVFKVDHVDRKVIWKLQISKIKSVELVQEKEDQYIKIESYEKEKQLFGSGQEIVKHLKSLPSENKNFLKTFKNKLTEQISRVFKEENEFEIVD
ncbi:hypothetical protein ABK040_015695 [Willaertia magna]